MAVTLKREEAIPATYPDPPEGLSQAAQDFDAAAVWQRIEAYTAWRWSEREVVWIAEGFGPWCAPLRPATITSFERWQDGAWVEYTPDPGPYGYEFAECGPHRITATVGGGDVPAVVLEAFRRLAEYMAATDEQPGATDYTYDVGPVKVARVQNAAWVARGMINSGAADLLRPYRRV